MILFALRSAICITAVVLALPGRGERAPDPAAAARAAGRTAVSAATSLCAGAPVACASFAATTFAREPSASIPARRPAPPRRAPDPE